MKSFLLLIALLIITFTKLKAEDKIRGLEDTVQITSYDEDRGISLGKYSIADDQAKLSLSYHLKLSPYTAADITSYDLSYSFKWKRFLGSRTWLDFGYQNTSAIFSGVSEKNAFLHSSFNQEDVDAQQVAVSSYYVGGTIQSNLIQSLYSSNRIFESLSAAITYNSYSEEFATGSFTGYGLKSTLGIYKRASKTVQYGLKATYNLSPVSKAPEEGETRSQNTLMLQWTTIAFDLSIYF